MMQEAEVLLQIILGGKGQHINQWRHISFHSDMFSNEVCQGESLGYLTWWNCMRQSCTVRVDSDQHSASQETAADTGRISELLWCKRGVCCTLCNCSDLSLLQVIQYTDYV